MSLEQARQRHRDAKALEWIVHQRDWWSKVHSDAVFKSLQNNVFKSLGEQPVIKPLIKVGLMLLKHKVGILNYFAHHITSGSVEGTVNKIKTLKRQAYGFGDMEYFKLRLLSFAPAGVHVNRMNRNFYSVSHSVDCFFTPLLLDNIV